MGWSEYLAAGYSEAQNLIFGTLFQIIAPYAVARLAIDREGLHVDLAKRMVIILFAIALIGLFEFRFGWNPFLTLGERTFFRGQGLGWVTTFRHGFARVAGPYAHCILAGMMMVMAYRLNRWLEWGNHWEPNLAASAAIGLISVAGYVGFRAYLDVEPGMEMTMSQETALYRKVLFEKYYAIALDHAWFGWGRNTWPKIPGMASIDNYYLLLALMHGVLTTVLLIGLIAWMGIRLFRKGMSEPLQANSIAFTFLGIIVAFAVSIVTVYLGEAVVPTFFLMLGWAEGYMQGKGHLGIGAADADPGAPPSAEPFRFNRVIR
jgi:hypothetical protein